MDIGITKMSSKGQIVIPADLRSDIKDGEKFVVIRNKDQLILKKVEQFSKNLEEDIEFAKRTEEALKRIDQGKGTELKFDEFIEEMKSW